MTEDSDNINITAFGGKTGAASNMAENCRSLTQKLQLITLGSSGSSTPNHGRTTT